MSRKTDQEASAPAPLARAPVPTAAPSAAPVPEPPGADRLSFADADAMLWREEIVDKKHRLCGYRFSFKGSGQRAAPAEWEFFEALKAADLPAFAERRIAVIPVSIEAIDAGHHLALATPNSMFLIDRRQAALPPEQLAGRLLALRAAGCKTALRGATLAPEDAPLLAACDAAFLDLSDCSLPQFQSFMRQLRAAWPALGIAVESVNSWDEQRMCLAWGCDFCLGHFLSTTDAVDAEAKIDQGRLTSIELLNLLRTDAEVAELVDVAKQDPGLAFHVLKWANAPSTGHHTVITSLKEAIIVLGRGNLYRWLTVSMFRLGSTHARDEALLEVALGRARFLEIAGEDIPQAARDELFLVGLLSLFDILLGMPMAAILDKMHLSEEIREVLLRSGGEYGPYLMLALLLERGQVGRAAELALEMGIAPDTLGATRDSAFEWAQEALHHSLSE
ncbi:EAL and HDOD domain-containing protein [Pseudoduganella namucuonensis]|uniref:EAL and HDOD domain-containing protein n=1 Tax=Pseudoduganella namucuonensis TaxID=1035707 RepID=UPI001E59CBCA|nr:HDOD domain-containing protein [Pseudoduganella namucuonensis]